MALQAMNFSGFGQIIRESLCEKGPNDLLPSCVNQNHNYSMKQGLNMVGLRIITNNIHSYLDQSNKHREWQVTDMILSLVT